MTEGLNSMGVNRVKEYESIIHTAICVAIAKSVIWFLKITVPY
jgi:hypothetical protein